MNHNLETVPRLYRLARPGSDYAHSLTLLREFKRRFPQLPTKSGLMVGLGETDDEILAVMRDMRAHDIDMLTLGQYLQPTAGHLPVLRYVHPDAFAAFEREAYAMGFRHAAVGALVRSSYHADGRPKRCSPAERAAAADRTCGVKDSAARAVRAAPRPWATGSTCARPASSAPPAVRRRRRSPRRSRARTAPRIAPPVSCASIRPRSGCEDSGYVVARNTGAPSGIERGSTASVRSRSSGTPSVPIGPSISASGVPGVGAGTSRKKT